MNNDDNLSFQSFQLLLVVVLSILSSLFSGLASYSLDIPDMGVTPINGVGAKVRSLSTYSSIILSERMTTAVRP
jgi:hypothetical protein